MDIHTDFEIGQTVFDITGTPIVVIGFVIRENKTGLIVLHPDYSTEICIDVQEAFLSKQALYEYEIAQEEERHQILMENINKKFNENNAD